MVGEPILCKHNFNKLSVKCSILHIRRRAVSAFPRAGILFPFHAMDQSEKLQQAIDLLSLLGSMRIKCGRNQYALNKRVSGFYTGFFAKGEVTITIEIQ